MTFWKRQNYGNNEKTSGCQGLGVRDGAVKLLCRMDHNDDTCYYTFAQTHRVCDTKSEA